MKLVVDKEDIVTVIKTVITRPITNSKILGFKNSLNSFNAVNWYKLMNETSCTEELFGKFLNIEQ